MTRSEIGYLCLAQRYVMGDAMHYVIDPVTLRWGLILYLRRWALMMTFETPEDKRQIDDRRYKQPENSTDNLNHRFIIAPFSTG